MNNGTEGPFRKCPFAVGAGFAILYKFSGILLYGEISDNNMPELDFD